jgi:hypothetical protein
LVSPFYAASFYSSETAYKSGCRENLIKDSTVHYSYGASAGAAATARGSQAGINVATDVIDMITDIRSHDEGAVSLKKSANTNTLTRLELDLGQVSSFGMGIYFRLW